MKRSLILGTCQGAGILGVLVLGVLLAYAADILTVDKDGTIRLRVSDAGKVTLNASTTTEGDLRFTTRSSDPSAPLSGDLWYNNTDKVVRYADGGLTKPLAAMTDATLNLYVNGSTGNDNNNGLTSGAAVKTIQKAVNLIPPIVRHAVTINVAAGTYRDTGATVGSYTYNVYVTGKVISDIGSITFLGDTATPADVRVTGSDSGADTTPVRNAGFRIEGMRNVDVKGFLCNYFVWYGISYSEYARGSPSNCVCNNNSLAGICYEVFSRGWPASCTSNSNVYGLLVNELCSVNPTSCTFNSNTNIGILCQNMSSMNINTCAISGNTSHGIYITNNSACYANNNTSTSNNGGWGIYSNMGSMVDSAGTTPNGNSGTTGANGDQAENHARIF